MVTFQIIAPRHAHDCDCCRYVGYDGGADVYTCGESVIRRFSDEGPDYSSFPLDIARQVPPFAVAVALVEGFRSLT